MPFACLRCLPRSRSGCFLFALLPKRSMFRIRLPVRFSTAWFRPALWRACVVFMAACALR